MVLDRENRVFPVPQPFDGVVVQIDVGHFEVVGQRVGVNGEAVVLTGNLDPTRLVVQHRLVRPTVSEFQLEGFAPQASERS